MKKQTCPNCGYCPHCGQSRQAQPFYPVYPTYPSYPYAPWYQPTITWTTATETIGYHQPVSTLTVTS